MQVLYPGWIGIWSWFLRRNLRKTLEAKQGSTHLWHMAGIKSWPLHHPYSPRVVMVGSNNFLICHTAEQSLLSIMLYFTLLIWHLSAKAYYICVLEFLCRKSTTDERTSHAFMCDNQHGITKLTYDLCMEFKYCSITSGQFHVQHSARIFVLFAEHYVMSHMYW